MHLERELLTWTLSGSDAVPHTASDLFKQQMRWAYGVVSAFMMHFKKVLKSRLIRRKVKAATLIFSSGYALITLLLLTTFFGLLNIICGLIGFDPASANSSTYTIGHFIYDSTLNLILTGGMLISSLVACFINGFGMRNLGRLFLASLTIGFICMFFVGRGIFFSMGRSSHAMVYVKKNRQRTRMKREFKTWQCRDKSISLGEKTLVMGILNTTLTLFQMAANMMTFSWLTFEQH